MIRTRRLFEPTGRFDRILYALGAATGPYTTLVCAGVPELEFATFVMGAWSIIASVYTIEWAILSYRRWKASE